MPGDSGFLPPVAYSPLWGILALGLILLVVGWVVFVLLFSRRGGVPRAPDLKSLPAPVLGPAVRNRYLGFIDDVTRKHDAGEIGYREAHHELSLVVRLFAAEVGGLRAQYMTLEELRAAGYDPLTDTVARLYPGAFSGTEHASVEQAAAEARKLVNQWR